MAESIPIETEIEVDLAEVNRIIHDEEFARYLLSSTSDFTAAAYILQVLLDRVAADQQALDNQ